MDDDPFSGWGLRPVELADRAVLDSCFASLAEPLSDYTFSQLYTWRNSLRILWKMIRGHLCVFANGTGDLTLLMPPIGDTGSDAALAEAFDLMNAYNGRRGVLERSRVEYVSPELLARLNPSGLAIRPMGADYIYDVAKMIDLPGGDLASKRQAKNRFMRNYDYRVESYCPANHREGCIALLEQWKVHQDAQHLEESDANALKRSKESIATALCLDTAEALRLKGMVVYVDGALRGFTFGEYLGRDQSSITIEKTDLEAKGLAQFIFSEFCRLHWADRPLVNVGDDWGLETLAWTKQSYRPVKLLEKFVLRSVPAALAGVPDRIAPQTMAVPGSEVSIRAACKQDLAAAGEMERASFTHYALNARQLQYHQQKDNSIFLVAQQDGHVVGDGIALVRSHKTGLTGRIHSLVVNPRSRGRKIGGRLLAALVAELESRGVGRIYLEVEQSNTAALHLYHRSGFRAIGALPDYYAPGKHATHMMYERAVKAAMLVRE